ncbi:MAG: hypothetical protein H8E31_16495, partial [Planctomycetes bacterium]|nr:hypothetical protein [Planctomycetota bacterium]
MPRLLSLGLAYLQWAWFEQHPEFVAPLEPIGLLGVLGVSWLIALRWALPRPRVPWEAGPATSFLGPQVLFAAFLAGFGGLHLWQDWELPAVPGALVGPPPYLRVPHRLPHGGGGPGGAGRVPRPRPPPRP